MIPSPLAEVLIMAACFTAVFCTELLVLSTLWLFRVCRSFVLFMHRTATSRALWIVLVAVVIAFYHIWARMSLDYNKMERSYKREISDLQRENDNLATRLSKCKKACPHE
jgi:sensor histidine kinase YesM